MKTLNKRQSIQIKGKGATSVLGIGLCICVGAFPSSIFLYHLLKKIHN
jgi:hypothetical protein